MSTNYYLRHIPSEGKINWLKKMIDKTADGTHFQEVINLVEDLYKTPDQYEQSKEWGVLHIGKRTAGWQFEWCTNIIKKNCSYIDKDGNYVNKIEYEYRYPLTKQGLIDFIKQDDVIVMNEYQEIIDKDEFLELAFTWCLDGLNSQKSKSNTLNLDEDHKKFEQLGFTFNSVSDTDFYNDGLRWCIWDDFI